MGSDELPAAAQTTLLDLNESKIPRNYRYSPYPKMDGLAAFAKKTFRSHKKSNQRIDTFRLCLDSDWYGLSGLAAKWTSKALKMGASDLTFRLNYISAKPHIFIPFDEVFAAEHVVTLCLDSLRVYQRLNVIKCSRLKSLALNDMSLSSDSFYNIVSCCPLIENLSLSKIYVYSYFNDCDSDSDSDREARRIPEGSTISLPKLTTLMLSKVHEYEIQNLFLEGDWSSKFPNLKELTLCLSSSEGKEVYFISIHSLEILNFSAYDNKCRVEFDVPSILNFTFEGKSIPNVSFRSTSTDQWEESYVRLTINKELSAMWFCKLSNFLKELRRSKIHLCLHWHYKDSFDYQAGEIEGLDLVELEDLTMDTKGLPCLSFNALLDGLFRICRPKMITQYESPPNNNDIFLCRALSERERGRKVKRLLIVSEFMVSLLDLEKVSCEELVDGVWRPQRLSMLLRDSQRRLHLKWKPSKLASITA